MQQLEFNTIGARDPAGCPLKAIIGQFTSPTWIYMQIVRGEMVEDPQLSPGVVGSRLGSNRLSLARETGVLTARPQGILRGKLVFAVFKFRGNSSVIPVMEKRQMSSLK